MMKPEVSFQDFLKLDIRCGTILSAEVFEKARKPALKLRIDFGEELGVLKTSAQITDHYTPEVLPGKKVMAVVNFPAKQIADMMSECLVLGFPDAEGKIVLAVPDREAPDGAKLF